MRYRNCIICNAKFVLQRNQKTCSRKCHDVNQQWHKERWRKTNRVLNNTRVQARRIWQIKRCLVCNEPFNVWGMMKTCSKRCSDESRRTYYQDNRDEILQKVALYRINNADLIKEKNRKRYTITKHKVAERQRIYRANNGPLLRNYRQRHRDDNYPKVRAALELARKIKSSQFLSDIFNDKVVDDQLTAKQTHRRRYWADNKHRIKEKRQERKRLLDPKLEAERRKQNRKRDTKRKVEIRAALELTRRLEKDGIGALL